MDGTTTARRDLRELEEVIRRADGLLRRAADVPWSGRAAEGYRRALGALVAEVHGAVLGLGALEHAMSRHLALVDEARRTGR